MSGHSKWHSIKHKKGAADAKRGKLFSKINRAILVAARNGGGDPDKNIELRNALLKAKEANMPKDTVDRAIKKGTGDVDGVVYKTVVYEAYAPCGVALVIEVLTDNNNRTTSDIRHILDRNEGSLGTSGCVAWMFE
ncbi:MAG TPA: YebC/PmpR family DNA-binding transcriptional regulator, partial [bacterium]|nr:YebC/PmpR family DNA-binding transcriptional regulator [bacterium]